jgi:glutaredoxin
MNWKKIGLVFLSALLMLSAFNLRVLAQDEHKCKDVDVHFFWAKGCPHCAKEKEFLNKLEKKYPEIDVKSYEVSGSKENLDHMRNLAQEVGANVRGVPFTVVGDRYFNGFYDEKTTGKEIEEAVKCLLPEKEQNNSVIPDSVNVPLIGKIKTKDLSLPIFSIVLGFLDGFNPCAMWTLLFLISLLLGIDNKRRRWILGTVFIVASSFVYFLFLAAWLNFFLFLGYVVWVRYLIGILAVSVGVYNFYDFWKNKDGGCKVTGDEKRRKIFHKIRNIVKDNRLFLAVVGIILLAFAVNMVELVCSAGLPAIFTKVLTLSKLPLWKYYMYLLLYILFFMIDDLIIFFTAMITLHSVGIESKYARFSNIIGGLLMLIIGIIMLFKPELLMFGG